MLASHQAGIGEAVAVMGTAITPDQVQLLAQHTEEVVLAMDADRAGREAMLRAQRVAKGKRCACGWRAMPGARTRPTCSPTGGERAASASASCSTRPTTCRSSTSGRCSATPICDSPAGRDQALDEVVPVLGAMGDSITRDELVREVADRLDVDPALVTRRMAASRSATAPRRDGARRSRPVGDAGDGDPGPAAARRPSRPRPLPLTPRERRERLLLAMCVRLAGRRRGLPRAAHAGAPLVADASAARRDWLPAISTIRCAGLPRDDEELVGARDARS